jgi:hypothetical protein
MSALKRQRQVMLALALVVIGSPLLSPGPAGAVSTTLSYDCGSPIGGQVFTVVVDTDLPTTMSPGQSVGIVTTTVLTLPAAVVDYARTTYSAVTAGASLDSVLTVNTASTPTTLAAPKTPLPGAPATAMSLTATGSSGNLLAGPIGTTYEIGTGNFTANLLFYKADGTGAGNFSSTCILQAAQNVHVDTVTVVPAPTTTTITVVAPVEYGAEPDVSAAVATAGAKAKPAGTIEFTFEGKTVKVEVKGGKAKATLPQALTMGVRPVTAKFTPTDKNLAVSETTKNVTVVRDQTTTTASAVYRDARNRLVGKGKVVAQHGTAVTGKVKFVLKRDGVKIRTALIGVNKFGAAKKVFKNVSKAGNYTVVARYLGSPSLKRSVDRAKLVV